MSENALPLIPTWETQAELASEASTKDWGTPTKTTRTSHWVAILTATHVHVHVDDDDDDDDDDDVRVRMKPTTKPGLSDCLYDQHPQQQRCWLLTSTATQKSWKVIDSSWIATPLGQLQLLPRTRVALIRVGVHDELDHGESE